MPEGPEIRRAADSLSRVLQGQTMQAVRFGMPRLQDYAKLLHNHRVLEIETRGKALLTHFDHGYSIYSHNQLYGVWRVIKGHRLPESKRSLRLLLQTEQHSAILYSASDISVWPTGELAQHPFLARIGPDIMDLSLSWRDVADRLRLPRFNNRSLATLYLDQAFLAGNGNYLRSEVLHDAKLFPKIRPSQLSRSELGRLARSTLTISRRSYATGGITLAPRLSHSLEQKGYSRGQRRFYVFGRADKPCYTCGSMIERSEVSSRRLYHCPSCQVLT
jgi:endonuclease-8